MKSLKTRAIAGLIAWCVASSAQAYDMEINITAEVALEGCVINNGADALIEFGSFPDDDLVHNAVPANSALIKPFAMPIKCDATGAWVTFDYTYGATPAAANPETIATTTPELGIAIAATSTDMNSGNWIVPNTQVDTVNLGPSGEGHIQFMAAPIGLAPIVPGGPFTAQLTINIIYP